MGENFGWDLELWTFRHAMNSPEILKQFLSFLRTQKRWWMLPIIITLLLITGLFLFSSSSALSPFLYKEF